MGLDKEHFFWIDIAKAISIFGVVYIHSGLIETSSLDSGSYFRFGVPIFIVTSFFLSEYYLQTRQDYSKIVFLKKRLVRLVIPYVVWSALYAIGQFYLGIRSTIDFGPTFAWQGQYFFVVLIQLTILYPFLRAVEISRKLLLIISAVTLVFLYIPCNYLGLNIPFIFSGQSPFFYWLFYMYLAIYLARNQRSKRTMGGFLDSFPSYSIALIILALPLLMEIENLLIDTRYPYIRISVLIVSSILTILFVKLNSHPKFLDLPIGMLSKYSLGIFCMNPMLIGATTKVASYLGENYIIFPQIPAFISRCSLASITCIMAILICLLLERAKCGLLVK